MEHLPNDAGQWCRRCYGDLDGSPCADDAPTDEPTGTYRIVRFYMSQHPREVVKEGLTLEEAKRHCRSEETSSRTCSTTEGLTRTREKGAWFEGFEEE